MRPLRMLSLTVAVCFVASSAVHAQFTTGLRRITTLTSLTLSATSVIGGPVVTGTVSIDPAAGSSGVTVKLVSSNPAIASVPPSVVVQPGTTTGAFIIQSHPVDGNPNVISDPPYSDISAQIGSATPKLVRLTVRPPSLSALSVDPATVAGGAAAAGTVTISGTAPAGGLTVSLSATGAETETDPRIQISSIYQQAPLTTVPAQLTVPAGATSATFPISTRPVTQLTSVEIKAAYGLFVSRQASLTLKPPAISSVTLSNTHPIGGESVTVTAAMSGPAPAGGVTFAVSIYGSGCGPPPVVPSSVQFPAGAASASFTAITQPGGWSGKIGVGYVSTDLFVRGLIILTDALTLPSTVTGGTTVTAQIKTAGAAGPSNCNTSLTLSSSNALYAQVPEKVVMAPGTNVVTFPITTTAVPAPQTVTISVFGNVGYGFASRSATLTLTP